MLVSYQSGLQACPTCQADGWDKSRLLEFSDHGIYFIVYNIFNMFPWWRPPRSQTYISWVNLVCLYLSCMWLLWSQLRFETELVVVAQLKINLTLRYRWTLSSMGTREWNGSHLAFILNHRVFSMKIEDYYVLSVVAMFSNIKPPKLFQYGTKLSGQEKLFFGSFKLVYSKAFSSWMKNYVFFVGGQILRLIDHRQYKFLDWVQFLRYNHS